jgi:isoleucyl-tRNA synthetase
VRLVQQARRDAGLHVSDRIALTLGVNDAIRAQIAPFTALITEPTLAVSLDFEPGEPNAQLDGEPVFIGVTKVNTP